MLGFLNNLDFIQGCSTLFHCSTDPPETQRLNPITRVVEHLTHVSWEGCSGKLYNSSSIQVHCAQMSASPGTDAWKTIDPWWDAFVETHSPAQVPEATSVLDDRWFEGIGHDIDQWWDARIKDHSAVEVDDATARLDSRMWDGLWRQLDPWWAVYVDEQSVVSVDESTAALDAGWRDALWPEIDPWWETYSEHQRQEAAEVATLLEELNDTWQQSDSRFDTDPLSTDWTAHSSTRGPLRPNQEENWSQWLAHLLRSNEDFVSELFGEHFDDSPDTVQREVYLPASNPDNPDRYADILLFAGRHGISIEVKKGDEHYEKTTHTAGLVENHHYNDWEHYLLLPDSKTNALEASFEDDLVIDQERPQIASEHSDPIDIVFWRDVTAAIRDTLRRGEGTNHWEASAYVFCTLVEQKILGFNPQEKVTELSSSNDVIHTSASLSVSGGDVGKQLTYLRETSLADNNDE